MRAIWQRAVSPAYRRKANVAVWINGKNMMNVWDPHLISVNVTLTDKNPDRAHVELDDRNAELDIPQQNSVISIDMGWDGKPPTLPLSPAVREFSKQLGHGITEKRAGVETYLDGTPVDAMPYQAHGMRKIFQGLITDVESGFSRRGGGRRLWVDAQSNGAVGAWKNPLYETLGEGEPDGADAGQKYTLGEFLSKLGGKIGVTVSEPSAMANQDKYKRPFWVADGESFQSIGERLSGLMGFHFKMIGNHAFIHNAQYQVDGRNFPVIEAVWGVNIIHWRIRPFSGRAEYKGTQQQFFDTFAGFFKTTPLTSIASSTPFGSSNAIGKAAGYAPNAHVGEQISGGQDMSSDRNRGTGWVTIVGEPYCVAFSHVVIVGCRPGVDGRYRVKDAEHRYDRGRGYETRCNLVQPMFDGRAKEAFDRMGWQDFPPSQEEMNTRFGYLTPIDGFETGVRTYNPDGSITTIHPDGSEDWTPAPSAPPAAAAIPEVQSVTVNPDGSVTTTYPDGSEAWTPAPYGVGQSVTNADGSVTTAYPDGSLSTANPDGSETITQSTAVVTRRLTNADGSVVTTFADGSTETIAADGTESWEPPPNY